MIMGFSVLKQVHEQFIMGKERRLSRRESGCCKGSLEQACESSVVVLSVFSVIEVAKQQGAQGRGIVIISKAYYFFCMLPSAIVGLCDKV
jgi:hypothetical protein